MRHIALALLLFAAVLFALIADERPASALDRNFAGSAQIDYNFTPTEHQAKAYPAAFDGFTMELSGKVAVDFSDHLSANLKVCFGCHGFEADMMYFDYRVSDELNVRLGRFSPTFGAFNLRHDPANHRLSDKPLPYDMGRMLRMRDWNFGVLPSPFPDNGIEINGAHWFGSSVELDYAVYAVEGFRGPANGTDLDFTLSHMPANDYVDNNGRPTGGGRIGTLVKLSDASDVSFGASGMYGTWDPNNELAYMILGGDFQLRLDTTVIRAEYLVRRQEFSVDDPSVFKYAVAPNAGDFFVKHGAYVEVEQPLTQSLDFMVRADGLYRTGNVIATSPLSDKSSVVRGTVGVAWAFERNLRLKASTEAWRFSDVDPTNGRQTEMSFHLGVVGTF